MQVASLRCSVIADTSLGVATRPQLSMSSYRTQGGHIAMTKRDGRVRDGVRCRHRGHDNIGQMPRVLS